MKVEVKKFTTNCNTNSGGVSPVTLYIGYPAKDSHPLAFQSRWLSDRGISIPQNIMESFSKLMEISEKNNPHSSFDESIRFLDAGQVIFRSGSFQTIEYSNCFLYSDIIFWKKFASLIGIIKLKYIPSNFSPQFLITECNDANIGVK